MKGGIVQQADDTHAKLDLILEQLVALKRGQELYFVAVSSGHCQWR